MASKNEKILASSINMIVEKLADLVDFNDCKVLLDSVKSILSEETISATIPRTTSSATIPYSYTGIDYITMREEERPEICRFAVNQAGRLILEAFWDRSLTHLLIPECGSDGNPLYDEDGIVHFIGSTMLKQPGIQAIRPKLKHWADTEQLQPGSFASKYYNVCAYRSRTVIAAYSTKLGRAVEASE